MRSMGGRHSARNGGGMENPDTPVTHVLCPSQSCIATCPEVLRSPEQTGSMLHVLQNEKHVCVPRRKSRARMHQRYTIFDPGTPKRVLIHCSASYARHSLPVCYIICTNIITVISIAHLHFCQFSYRNNGKSRMKHPSKKLFLKYTI